MVSEQESIEQDKPRKPQEIERDLPFHPTTGPTSPEVAEELDSLQLDLILRASKHMGPPKMVIEGWIKLLEEELCKFDDTESQNYKSIKNTITSLRRYREAMGKMSKEEQEQFCSEH